MGILKVDEVAYGRHFYLENSWTFFDESPDFYLSKCWTRHVFLRWVTVPSVHSSARYAGAWVRSSALPWSHVSKGCPDFLHDEHFPQFVQCASFLYVGRGELKQDAITRGFFTNDST